MNFVRRGTDIASRAMRPVRRAPRNGILRSLRAWTLSALKIKRPATFFTSHAPPNSATAHRRSPTTPLPQWNGMRALSARHKLLDGQRIHRALEAQTPKLVIAKKIAEHATITARQTWLGLGAAVATASAAGRRNERGDIGDERDASVVEPNHGVGYRQQRAVGNEEPAPCGAGIGCKTGAFQQPVRKPGICGAVAATSNAILETASRKSGLVSADNGSGDCHVAGSIS